MAHDRSDVVIIGAGVIGAAIAFELCKMGFTTVNVDRLPAAGYGSTSSSSAIVRAHYSSKAGVAMAYEGFSYWQNWAEYLGTADDSGFAEYINCGVVLLMSKTKLHDKVLHHYADLGVEHEVWTTSELARRCPVYDIREFWPPRSPDDPRFADEPEHELPGAVFTPGAGYLSDPQLAARNLQNAAEHRGGRFLFNAEVVQIRQRAGSTAGVTLANGQRIDAPVVVNAAGPYSSRVNHIAGVESDMRIRTRPLRQEVHEVPGPPGFDFGAKGHITSDGDLGIYFRPASSNRIVVGTEDPECDPRTWITDPERWDRHISRRAWEAQVYRLARRIPSLRIPNRPSGVVDLYDVSDDWIPIYDRSALDGFYMAIGTSGNQFKNAPVVGYIMAELIDAVEAGHDHDRNPMIVRSAFRGIDLDLGHYSRRREINTESTLQVTG